MKWYERAIPKIKDIEPYLKKAAKSLSENPQIKNIYVWGSLAEKYNNKEYRIKDIDILIECNFNSGDLLAIDNNKDGALKIAKNNLEDLGFNTEAVDFTKTILRHKIPSIDFWAISGDKKLLHWGPITETVEEWKQIRKEAEEKTETLTGIKKKEIIKASEINRKKWHAYYEKHIQDYSNGCPQGWYSSQNNVDKIFEKAIKL